ncbi:hypothetical protein EVAR_45237_1 [Eumeta japonica]|uniref:Uncharacterized protein n=1 Tax=Eumeta variegata TaxID=151549 RepID=A0A4C1XFZ7_EUMVA|nr:hypothetical protein EVAR_45237_1 [Eumeta japonica]
MRLQAHNGSAPLPLHALRSGSQLTLEAYAGLPRHWINKWKLMETAGRPRAARCGEAGGTLVTAIFRRDSLNKNTCKGYASALRRSLISHNFD